MKIKIELANDMAHLDSLEKSKITGHIGINSANIIYDKLATMLDEEIDSLSKKKSEEE